MQADTQFLRNSLSKIREWRLQSPFRKRLRGRVCLVFADFCESAEVLVATGRARCGLPSGRCIYSLDRSLDFDWILSLQKDARSQA